MKILFTGGSACGKSTLAEAIAARMPEPRYYIAAMIPRSSDDHRRVLRHQKHREGTGFVTIERYTDIAGLNLPQGGTVLLECLCHLTANEIFEPNGAGTHTKQKILQGLDLLAQKADNLIVITNDVSSDGLDYDEDVIFYVQTVGEINSELAERFDCVCEMCCGIPLLLKGSLPEEFLSV